MKKFLYLGLLGAGAYFVYKAVKGKS